MSAATGCAMSAAMPRASARLLPAAGAAVAEDELADPAGGIAGIHCGPPCRSRVAAAASTSMISATRPGRGDITTTRSASSTASGIECVTNRMVFGRSLPDAHQLEGQLLARQRVERAERLVHQQDVGIVHQRAADAGALLHAAGQLARILALEAGEADEREQVARALASGARRAFPSCRAGTARCRERSPRAAASAPGRRCRSRRAARSPRAPPIETVPPVGGTRPATSRSSVDLPQPDGPTRQTNSLRRTSSETSDMATTCSPPRVTKVLATWSSTITHRAAPQRSRNIALVDHFSGTSDSVERLVRIPFRIEVLRLRQSPAQVVASRSGRDLAPAELLARDR